MSEPRLRNPAINAIAIGASAGGTEALAAVLSSLPSGLRAAVFIVLHQPRARASPLVEIFSRKCRLPVREAEDKQPVEAGTVYLAPPDYHLLIDRQTTGTGAQLALSVDDLVCYSRPSIDVLFESAADAYGARLLGIVLTGANDDGALGLKAIQAAGGMTLVQDPRSANSSYMPAAARDQVPEALILSLDEMTTALQQLESKGNR